MLVVRKNAIIVHAFNFWHAVWRFLTFTALLSLGCSETLSISHYKELTIKGKFMNKYVLCLLLASLFSLAACDSGDGPAERAGEEIDNSIKTTQDTLHDVSESAMDKAKKLSEDTKDVMKNSSDKVKDVVDDLKEK